uniref:Uncharacterized protein n=1 Tax=Dendroctonus ponderosae TaxID=77166 RepID=A0AAR5P597_DENPD
MVFQFLLCFIGLVSLVQSAVIVPSARVLAAPAVAAPVAVARLSDATYDVNPQYSFGYDVQDSLTGDSKAQIETRNGDFWTTHIKSGVTNVVSSAIFYLVSCQQSKVDFKGQKELWKNILLLFAGTRRIVDYTADPVNGFNAVIRKAPVAVAAPLVAAPVAPAAPLVARAIAAPLIAG